MKLITGRMKSILNKPIAKYMCIYHRGWSPHAFNIFDYRLTSQAILCCEKKLKKYTDINGTYVPTISMLF